MAEIKKIPTSRIEFKDNGAARRLGKYLDKAASEVSEEIKIAGFRPGKAPRNLVERKSAKAWS